MEKAMELHSFNNQTVLSAWFESTLSCGTVEYANCTSEYDCELHLIVRPQSGSMGEYGVPLITITPRSTLTRFRSAC